MKQVGRINTGANAECRQLFSFQSLRTLSYQRVLIEGRVSILLCQRLFHPSIFPFHVIYSTVYVVESSTVRAISLSLLFLLPLFYGNPIWSDSSLSTLLLVRLDYVDSRGQQTKRIFGKVMLPFFSLASIKKIVFKSVFFARAIYFAHQVQSSVPNCSTAFEALPSRDRYISLCLLAVSYFPSSSCVHPSLSSLYFGSSRVVHDRVQVMNQN